MISVFATIFPIIAVTSCGYWCARQQYLLKSQLDGLSKLTFNILIPAFLFVTMATTPMDNVFDFKLIAAFYLPVLTIYGLNMAWHYRWGKNQPRELGSAAVYAMGNTYSNVVLLGLPVILSALGQSYVPYVLLLLSLHGIIMIGFTSFCASFNADNHSHSVAHKLYKMISNPVLASIVGGMLYNLSGIGLHPVIASSLQLLGKPGISCALLLLGSSLHFYTIKGELTRIALLSVTKLLLLPFTVWLAATQLFELSQPLTAIVVILSACPTGINAYLVACEQQRHQALIASTVVSTTILCMFSMTGWLWFLL